MDKMDFPPRNTLNGWDRPGDTPPKHSIRPRREQMPEDDCGCEQKDHPLWENGCGCEQKNHPLRENGCGCERPPSAPNGNGCGAGCVGHEGCGDGSWGLNGYPPAMVYAPCQIFCALYDPTTALKRGTVFSTLDLPLGSEGGGFVTDNGAPCRERR